MTAAGAARPVTIDCRYLRERYAAAYLLTEGQEAAFIENNTTHSVPLLLEALGRRGLRPEQVTYAIVTHVHLDHAGGSSALLAACPHATLLAHPKAAEHLIDPSKLIASSRQVYGDEAFDALYGKIVAIDPKRVRVMRDGEELPFGARTLRFVYTRGHANHHFCIHDSRSGGVFTGDSFGLAYPALQSKGLFVFPSTSPTGFEPEEARLTVRKIVASGARPAFLTHYGELDAIEEAAGQLLEQIDFAEALLEEAAASDVDDARLDAFCRERLRAHFEMLIRRRGLEPETHAWDWMKNDWELNAAGIAHVAQRRRKGR